MFSGGKGSETVKASGQSCNIPPIRPIYDEVVLKCLIYLLNNQKYYLEQF